MYIQLQEDAKKLLTVTSSGDKECVCVCVCVCVCKIIVKQNRQQHG